MVNADPSLRKEHNATRHLRQVYETFLKLALLDHFGMSKKDLYPADHCRQYDHVPVLTWYNAGWRKKPHGGIEDMLSYNDRVAIFKVL